MFSLVVAENFVVVQDAINIYQCIYIQLIQTSVTRVNIEMKIMSADTAPVITRLAHLV